jgi:hypothetical protein
MSNPVNKLNSLLKQHKFELVRHQSHRIFQNPEGKVLVLSSTPSGHLWAHKAVADLNRVVNSPAQPVFLAITDFERNEAQSLIQGQAKFQHAASGQGSGKQRRSSGTGYRYEDRVVTAEQLAQREELRVQALAVKARQEERRQRRRTEKLQRREIWSQQEQQEEKQFEVQFGPFLKHCEQLAIDGETNLMNACDAWIEGRGWKDSNFYEFATDKEVLRIEQMVNKLIKKMVCAFKEERLFSLNKVAEEYAKTTKKFGGYKERPAAERIRCAVKMIRKPLVKSSDLGEWSTTLDKMIESTSLVWDVKQSVRLIQNEIFTTVVESEFLKESDEVTIQGEYFVAVKYGEGGNDDVEKRFNFIGEEVETEKVEPELEAVC